MGRNPVVAVVHSSLAAEGLAGSMVGLDGWAGCSSLDYPRQRGCRDRRLGGSEEGIEGVVRPEAVVSSRIWKSWGMYVGFVRIYSTLFVGSKGIRVCG